ncbi:unnamed protein product [Brachionus calyciflorus]|uniref:Uncharacterized protein n=1 Tax=Brachionus calyciflorus TaxID=104777 RepID=A0A813RAP8_9BILA|nr:unnamed protein product [Brachionus calyciflorus]
MKAHLCKTFIGPIVFYGLECFSLTKTDLLMFKRFEGKIVKKNLRNTEKKLWENEYTQLILNELEKTFVKNGFISEILEIIGDDKIEIGMTTYEACKIALNEIIYQNEIEKKKDNLCNQIKNIMNERDKKSMVKEISEKLKFNNPQL